MDFLSDVWRAIDGWILPVAALVISVLTAIYARRQVHAVREQTDALRDQTAVLRDDLEESQRQWEATGPVFRMDGKYVTASDIPDGPMTDRLAVTVTNDGRMPGFIRQAFVTDRANIKRHPVHGNRKVEVAPHGSQKFHVRRNDVPWAQQQEEWTEIVFGIVTDTGDTLWWSTDTGTARSVKELGAGDRRRRPDRR